MKKVTLYKNVFNRVDTTEIPLEDFLQTPSKIFNSLGLSDYKTRTEEIKSIKDKDLRNHEKRNYYPAVDLAPANILSIDIDGISEDADLIEDLIVKFKSMDSCYACMETASGNLVALFKYKCSPEDFRHLYYKLFLELTLSLGVNIDFLPEINRLRYVSTGELYFINKDSRTLTEILKVKKVPYIRSTVGTGEPAVFKSN